MTAGLLAAEAYCGTFNSFTIGCSHKNKSAVGTHIPENMGVINYTPAFLGVDQLTTTFRLYLSTRQLLVKTITGQNLKSDPFLVANMPFSETDLQTRD